MPLSVALKVALFFCFLQSTYLLFISFLYTIIVLNKWWSDTEFSTFLILMGLALCYYFFSRKKSGGRKSGFSLTVKESYPLLLYSVFPKIVKKKGFILQEKKVIKIYSFGYNSEIYFSLTKWVLRFHVFLEKKSMKKRFHYSISLWFPVGIICTNCYGLRLLLCSSNFVPIRLQSSGSL